MDDETGTGVSEVTSPAKGECVVCGKALAFLGLVIGAVFLYVSIDVLMGGRLTSALTRKPVVVEEVTEDV